MRSAPGPDFLIIGAMKSATSTLHEQLAAQPGFFMSRPKEPNFFSDDEVYARGLEWYRRLFAGAPAGALRGESSTHYTKLPHLPRTLERLVPALGAELKVVYMMRHPVDRLVSHYVHDWTQRVISAPIEEALARHASLVDYGRYAMQLEPWLRAFGPERVLPVFFDRFRLHPQAELERIAAFLGAARPPAWSAELSRRNLSSERLRAPSWMPRSLVRPARHVARWLVPAKTRARITSGWRITEPPELDAARRAELERVFDLDLARLGAWLGMPLDCRGFKRLTTDAVPGWTADAPRPA